MTVIPIKKLKPAIYDAAIYSNKIKNFLLSGRQVTLNDMIGVRNSFKTHHVLAFRSFLRTFNNYKKFRQHRMSSKPVPKRLEKVSRRYSEMFLMLNQIDATFKKCTPEVMMRNMKSAAEEYERISLGYRRCFRLAEIIYHELNEDKKELDSYCNEMLKKTPNPSCKIVAILAEENLRMVA